MMSDSFLFVFIKGAAAWKHCGTLWCPGKWHLVSKNHLFLYVLAADLMIGWQSLGLQVNRYFLLSAVLKSSADKFFFCLCIFPNTPGWPRFMFLHRFTSTNSDGVHMHHYATTQIQTLWVNTWHSYHLLRNCVPNQNMLFLSGSCVLLIPNLELRILSRFLCLCCFDLSTAVALRFSKQESIRPQNGSYEITFSLSSNTKFGRDTTQTIYFNSVQSAHLPCQHTLTTVAHIPQTF